MKKLNMLFVVVPFHHVLKVITKSFIVFHFRLVSFSLLVGYVININTHCYIYSIRLIFKIRFVLISLNKDTSQFLPDKLMDVK